MPVKTRALHRNDDHRQGHLGLRKVLKLPTFYKPPQMLPKQPPRFEDCHIRREQIFLIACASYRAWQITIWTMNTIFNVNASCYFLIHSLFGASTTNVEAKASIWMASSLLGARMLRMLMPFRYSDAIWMVVERNHTKRITMSSFAVS